MPRLVRRKPLSDRIKDFLNPGDFWLWLSEEIETRDWDSKNVATPFALGLHFILLIARANTGSSRGIKGDDVFGDDYSGTGWLSFIATFVVYILTGFSIVNAAYTLLRKRHYRLFESSIDAPQTTPSAHRVSVDSSPDSSSTIRIFTSILGDTGAESRAHPDPTRDVWELAIWDPLPVNLWLFCLFSPGHVLVYLLFLPTLSSDPRPSVTVFTTILLEALLSSQLLVLQSFFSQQEKDSAVIHKEVMSEYDIKFVHPRLNPLVRDVGIQCVSEDTQSGAEEGVDTYTPTVILKRGFRTNPNPNYAKHIDPTNASVISRQVLSPAQVYTPSAYNSREPTPFSAKSAIRQPQFRQSMGAAVSTGTGMNDGGSLGIYSHANSPLKKATSLDYMRGSGHREPPRNSFAMAEREIQEERERSSSPAKRQSEAPRMLLGRSKRPLPEVDGDRRTSTPNSFGLKSRPGNYDNQFKRGPSRF